MKALEAIDGWIFRAYRSCAPALPFYRVLVGAYLVIFYLPRFGWVGDMPASFFLPPPGLGMFFLGFPPPWVCWTLDFLLVLAALCLLVGWRTRFVSFALAAGIVLGSCWRFSIGGKVDHDILLPAALFCLGFSDWGRRYSRDELRLPRKARRSTTTWPVALLALIIGLCLLSAAYPKAFSGWLSPSLFAVRGWITGVNLVLPATLPGARLILSVHSPLFWKMADWSTLLIEGGFILCVFTLPTMRFIVAVAACFHTLIFFTMGIFFSTNLIAYASVLDARLALRRARVRHAFIRFHRMTHRVGLLSLALVALALVGVWYFDFYYGPDLNLALQTVAILLVLAIALASLLNVIASGADRIVFQHSFPLRFNHSLVVLYDGECGLCDRSVQFILQHDRRGIFRFAALQSPLGRERLERGGLEANQLTTMVLLIDDHPYLRSTAALMILRQIGGAWSLLGGLGFVPAPIRDLIYHFVAANRRRWFPKSGGTCLLPAPDERGRFLS